MMIQGLYKNIIPLLRWSIVAVRTSGVVQSTLVVVDDEPNERKSWRRSS